MRNFGKWLWLLNKRLYKKATFLLILLLIPALVLGYDIAAQEESGVMTIALAQQGDDPMANSVMDNLLSQPSLIRFVMCDSPEAARQMITDGKAEAAWIFPNNMEQRLYRFISNPSKYNAFVQVVEYDSSIPLKLTREKLTGTLFAYASRAFYLNYIRENVPALDHLSDEELGKYYDDFATDIDLFVFESLDGKDTHSDSQANYLLTPVRGLLATVIVLGGLAAAMYYIRDNSIGTFSFVPQRHRMGVELICQIIAVGNLSIVTMVALLISGLSPSIGREIPVTLLYILTVALFCMNIRRWCQSLTALGTALPLTVVVMLVICPIFFDLGTLRALQYLFPPTYYVNAVYSDRFLLLMILYNTALLILYILSGKLLRKE